MVSEFVDDDKGFAQWMKDNPRGFVVNCDRKPTDQYMTMHRVRCLSRQPPRTGDYRKVCAPTVDELDMWAFKTVQATPDRCTVCHPS
jgi:hypothetical protein